MNWWSTLDTVANANRMALYATAGFAVLTFLGSLLTVLTSKRRAHRFTTSSSNEVPRRPAASADEGVAVDQALQDALEQSESLVHKLDSKDVEIETLRRQLKEERQKQQATEHLLAEQQRREQVHEENQRVQKAQAAVRARLPKEQREHLKSLLAPGPKGDLDIIAVMDNESSGLLAEELRQIFDADGWTTKPVIQSAFSDMPNGLLLAVNSRDTAPSYASFLQRTLTTIGFEVSATVNRKYREWSLTLVVGKANMPAGSGRKGR
jgi:Skp family chaperone for outer membrane proteins